MGKHSRLRVTKTLWELEQPSAVPLRGFGDCLKECCPFRHEKQSMLSAKTFALCVGVFQRNAGQYHRGCVSSQAVHLTGFVGRTLRPTVDASVLDVEANTFNAVFVF